MTAARKVLTIALLLGAAGSISNANPALEIAPQREGDDAIVMKLRPESGVQRFETADATYVLYSDRNTVAKKLGEMADKINNDADLEPAKRAELRASIDRSIAAVQAHGATAKSTTSTTISPSTPCGTVTLDGSFWVGINSWGFYSTIVDATFKYHMMPGPPAPWLLNITVWAMPTPTTISWKSSSYGPFTNTSGVTVSVSAGSGTAWEPYYGSWAEGHLDAGSCGQFVWQVYPNW